MPAVEAAVTAWTAHDCLTALCNHHAEQHVMIIVPSLPPLHQRFVRQPLLWRRGCSWSVQKGSVYVPSTPTPEHQRVFLPSDQGSMAWKQSSGGVVEGLIGRPIVQAPGPRQQLPSSRLLLSSYDRLLTILEGQVRDFKDSHWQIQPHYFELLLTHASSQHAAWKMAPTYVSLAAWCRPGM